MRRWDIGLKPSRHARAWKSGRRRGLPVEPLRSKHRFTVRYLAAEKKPRESDSGHAFRSRRQLIPAGPRGRLAIFVWPVFQPRRPVRARRAGERFPHDESRDVRSWGDRIFCERVDNCGLARILRLRYLASRYEQEQKSIKSKCPSARCILNVIVTPCTFFYRNFLFRCAILIILLTYDLISKLRQPITTGYRFFFRKRVN